jgi:hypothetical protein
VTTRVTRTGARVPDGVAMGRTGRVRQQEIVDHLLTDGEGEDQQGHDDAHDDVRSNRCGPLWMTEVVTCSLIRSIGGAY